ncbi:hypothetical protein JQ615_04720 [Bradyrhizobium jicamae]|uniref:PepSY domain-containing protein n=1 Tax=Bradyrhizobium jicamae TaxID=280332 RepID=A0ABS5FD41_9BRAD|nr:hypothetical protein [Bradyrhizobium jicamae]MBR0794693.1 hypothetical protein [Bradyrhizobium jicamae]
MLRFAFGILLVGSLAGSAAQAETVKNMLAAQLRTQGYTCDKALGARQDARLSKPDDEAWILRCSNATYRIRRAPDMAAKVEVIRQRHPAHGQQ